MKNDNVYIFEDRGLLYLNGEDVRFLQGLETETNNGDEISIVPAVAGGYWFFLESFFELLAVWYWAQKIVLKLSNLSSTIDSRICFIRLAINVKLWMLANLSANSSLALNKWCK